MRFIILFFLIYLAKKIEDINDAYDEVLDILKEFMKKWENITLPII